VLSGGKRHAQIQGIGAGLFHQSENDYIDEVITVTNDEAYRWREGHSRKDCSSVSSGAAVVAALKVASRADNAGKMIVTVLPSFGERYLTSILFETLRNDALAIPTSTV
jgi:cysteine synthase A